MKRHVQQVGVRKWAGGDLIELQAETLKALDGFFAEYGPCVLQGCAVTARDGVYDVSPGLAVLSGTDQAGAAATMVVPFDGATGTALPLYLTLACNVVERAYADEQVKAVAYEYYAEGSAVAPAEGVPSLQITAGGVKRFVDAVQNPSHRFTTDAQQSRWDAKETPAGAQAKADAALATATTQTETLGTAVRGELSVAVATLTGGKLDKTAGAEGVKNHNAAGTLRFWRVTEAEYAAMPEDKKNNSDNIFIIL